jgi:WD40 repeat protein/serine/threonine protein kinase
MVTDPKRVQAVFLAAVADPSPAGRAAVLDRECGPDADLRRRVEALLKANDEPGSFLDRPAAGGTGAYTPDPGDGGPSAEPAAAETPGTRIGPYKLLQLIGEGGMGAVWMAEQQEPVRRMVALKVIKAGMDSAQVVARFEAERQALAVMDHPHIAKVFDGGTTELGRPFFVMELVKGIPITKYCDEHRLTPKQRLELFVPVCQALQHAHQKGVIHRDLKPSNVLVAPYDGRPVPKVIDFGVAKATGQRLTDRTMFTGFGAVVGTLEYMSPEQAELNNQDIDTRSDVYSLGVLLYELLTGATPLSRQRLKAAAFDEVLRLIREEEPPKPSTRLSGSGEKLPSIAAQRQTEPAKLTKLMRGELDWIVMKALEKDRGRRYETANGFALDIQRYLADEPVLAGPPGAGYRLRKYAHKHRAALAVVAGFAVLLVAGTAVSAWQAWRAKVAEREARTADDLALDAKRRADAVAASERDTSVQARQALAVSLVQQAQVMWRDSRNVLRARALLQEVPEDLRGWEWHYLKRRFLGSGVTLYGHASPVFCAAFSPDGQRLATSGGTVPAGGDQAVKVWDVRTGRELLSITRHGALIWRVAYSPDGQRLATASHDGTAKVWDATTGRELLILAGHTGPVARVVFSPDGGRRLATASFDKTARIWDAATGQQLRTLPGHTDLVEEVAFSPDGQRLATASWDKTARVWDVATGRLIFPLQGHTDGVTGVAFSPDGQRLATSSFDRTAKVWDAVTGQELLDLKHTADSVVKVAFSPDGRRLATAGRDRTVRIWDVASGRELRTLQGHSAGIQGGLSGVTWAAYSPDGQRLATTSWDGTVKLWDMRDDQETLTLPGHAHTVLSVAYSPDGRRLATSSADGTARIWDTATNQTILTLDGHSGTVLPTVFTPNDRRPKPDPSTVKEIFSVLSVAYSPDGRRLATGHADGLAKVWDAATGELLLTLRGHGAGWVRWVAYSPNGRHIATASWDKTAKVWDALTGQCLFTLAGHTDSVNRLAYSPDGRHIATASLDHTAKVWDAATGRELLTFPQHTDHVYGVAFSPDGKRLATTSRDHTARVWDAATGQQFLVLPGHTLDVDDVAFTPDGRRLVTICDDQRVKVWDALTDQELLTLTGHTGRVLCALAFSRPDGRRLATGGADRTVRIWDARPVVEPLALKGHTGSVTRSVFSPDGGRLATGSEDGTAKVWDLRRGQDPLTLTGHSGPVTTVVFSPDGGRLATSSRNGTVCVWDALTAQSLCKLPQHMGPVFGLAFSPNGDRLATASGEWNRPSGTATIWDARTGKKVLTVGQGHTKAVQVVAFSPDGRRLATIAWTETKVWDALTGHEVTDPEAGKFLLSGHNPRLSPDERFLVHPEGTVVYVHDRARSIDAEEMAFREAVARPDPAWQEEQAVRYEQERQWFAAAVHLDQILAAHPEAPLHARRGRARAELGRWEDARADFARAVAEQPDDPDAWHGLALTQLALQQPADYRQTCARTLEHFAHPPEAAAVGQVLGSAVADPFSRAALALSADPLLVARRSAARTAVLRSDAVSDPARLLSWAGGDRLVRGAVLCRAGRHAEAVQALADRRDAAALLYRALAEHGRGNDEAARAALAEAEHGLAAPGAGDAQPSNTARLPWDQRAEIEALRAEARALLLPAEP